MEMPTHLENFRQFIRYGRLGTQTARQEFVEQLHSLLYEGKEVDLTALQDEAPYAVSAVKEILRDERLRSLCRGEETVSQEVIAELIELLQVSRHTRSQSSDYEEEELALDRLKRLDLPSFPSYFKQIVFMLRQTYQRSQLDISFYSQELKALREQSRNKETDKALQGLKSHLEERWESLLQEKQLMAELAAELEAIDALRAQLQQSLSERMDMLEQLQQALAPLAEQLGRLWDMSLGKLRKMNFSLLQQYATRLQQNPILQDLATMLGRMQSESSSEEELQEEEYIHRHNRWHIDKASRSDLVGLHMSDDLGSLLPTEVALLADPVLEQSFYSKYLEKKLQTFEFQGRILKAEEERRLHQIAKAKEQKGPIIICVDTSGSMEGAPERVAKTLCFALLRVALEERRSCYLINFSTSIETMELGNMPGSLEALLDFLGKSFYGGTDVQPALEEALRMLHTASYRKADVLVVSDFFMPALKPTSQQALDTARDELGTRFHSLVIGSSPQQQALKGFDNCWHYSLDQTSGQVKQLSLWAEALR